MDDPQLSVHRAGEGPAIVLLHGLTATHKYVVHGSKSLERAGHDVIAYDARGHGDSEPADVYDYPSLATDLGRVLDEAGAEQAVLAGASMGAHTALAYALDNPERVAGLVVVTPAWTEDRDPDLDDWDRLANALRDGGVEGFVDAYDFSKVPDEYRETVTRVLEQRLGAHAHPEAVADALEQVPRSAPYDGLADLGGLPDVPVVVVGSRDAPDPGHPLEVAQRYADAIDGARLELEEEGESPIAWRGGTLSKLIAEVAETGNGSGT